MKIANGAECPVCGCRDTEVTSRQSGGWPDRRTTTASIRHARWRCKYCGTAFNASEPATEGDDQKRNGSPSSLQTFTATYHPTRCDCPFCGSDETRVTSSPGNGRRKHKCDDCEMPFESIEVK